MSRFYTTKRIDKGTGLGLATVLGIIREHSGYIDVNNLPESGLEIQIYLHQLESSEDDSPESDRKVEPAHNVQVSSQSPICVLLAEDDPEVMRLAVEGLGASGIRVICSTNGLDAIKVFKENRDAIDILVFDVMMPEMNGPEAYREIQLHESESNFPIIFTTGYAGDRLTGIEGNHKVINKPYSMQELVSAIRRVEKNNDN